MCEANDSLTSSTRVWPPPEGSGENFDEMWDDCELLAKYAQVEMQVKAQVEAFRSGKTPLPPPLPPQPQPSSTGNKSIHEPATSGGNAAVTSAPASSRKKRRHHNKNKRKGGGGVGGIQGNDAHHPLCSQCSHGGEANQWTPSAASITSESAVAAAAANLSYSTAAAAASSQFGAAGSGSGVAPVYSWLLPNLDLHPELLPPPPPPSLSSAARCSCNHHHFLLPTPSDTVSGVTTTPPASSLPPSLSSLPLTTANGEINTAVLLRAWYEAGYAMGQAHAEQILGLRPSIVEIPGGPSDGGVSVDDGDGDDDDAEDEEEEEDLTKPI
ncbi:hypothetical transcript [Echinococcus multilocularis]|uniref:Hypothetical transcript n=1 Tax=Echinococcus multilocularis TaxID=6211 RepID=A0A068XWD4_ECHMU|nr:hypothetical transcript [Echinococcus multilocularis]